MMKSIHKLSFALTAACLMLMAFGAPAQSNVAHHGMTSSDYQTKYDDYKKKGYLIVLVDGYAVGNTANYAAIWEKTTGPAVTSHHRMTSSDYQAKYDDYKKQGYRIVLVDGYAVGNTVNYAAIWEKTTGPAINSHHGMTSSEYQTKHDDYKKKGYRLVWVSGYGVGKTGYGVGQLAFYAAIWEKSSGTVSTSHHGMTGDEYQTKFDSYKTQGYRLKMVSSYNVGNTDYYAAIWEKTGGAAQSARHRMMSLEYQNEFDNHKYSGYKIKQVSGCEISGKERYAAIWESSGAWSSADLDHINKTIGDFMVKYDVPGASVALVKDGRLVFSKGYGTMDKSTGEVPGPNTMFRIGSVSKPVTSVAVMKLIQDNKFKISDCVFGTGGLLGTTYGSNVYSDWEKEITVQHLLEHTAGGDQWNNEDDGNAGDPMREQPSYNHSQRIGWVLDTRNPGKKPGTEHLYSNFGFCVLGRIIEKKSGETYENYVKNKILTPCGVTNMHIGTDTQADRRYNEAVYYNDGSDPYGRKVSSIDSPGGWIASSADLMRFLVKVDGFNTKPDIINATSFNTMITPCSVKSNYGKGWRIDGTDYYHAGKFEGTSAIMLRAGNGPSWAFLMNCSCEGNDKEDMMKNVVKGIKNWPSHDLF
ncbi:MAG: serine hydrolase [Saprospiraceae bacterium]